MKQIIKLKVNGAEEEKAVHTHHTLLEVLRGDYKLFGAREGCGRGMCGACTVLIDGKPTRSCVFPVDAAAGKKVTTLEGLGTEASPHPLQRAFMAEQAAQCGYCANGMIVTAKALLDRTPRPTEAQVRKALGANLCRCGTHNRIVRAVLRASKEVA
jgi:nicotinate dehydrogenase subunit A